MTDVSAADLLEELNRVNRRISLFPMALVVALLLVTALISAPFFLGAPLPSSERAFDPRQVSSAEVLRDQFSRELRASVASSLLWWAGAGTIAILSAPLLLTFRRRDVRDGRVSLNYDLEPDAEAAFLRLSYAFTQLADSQGLWHVTAEGATHDRKRHAGADSVVNRRSVTLRLSRPPRVECNLEVPTFPAGRQTLYFFPDRMLVYDPKGVGAVPYGDLKASLAQVRFREDDEVPGDADVVGTTWRYVNRNGGPDRRFNNNREIPIVLYGQLSFESASGLKEVFQASQPKAVSAFLASIGQLRQQR